MWLHVKENAQLFCTRLWLMCEHGLRQSVVAAFLTDFNLMYKIYVFVHACVWV